MSGAGTGIQKSLRRLKISHRLRIVGIIENVAVDCLVGKFKERVRKSIVILEIFDFEIS